MDCETETCSVGLVLYTVNVITKIKLKLDTADKTCEHLLFEKKQNRVC